MPISFRIKSKILSKDYKTTCPANQHPTRLASCLQLLRGHSFCSSPTDLLNVSQIRRAHCGLRGCCICSSAWGWNALSPLFTQSAPLLHSGLCLNLTLLLRVDVTHPAIYPFTLICFSSQDFSLYNIVYIFLLILSLPLPFTGIFTFSCCSPSTQNSAWLIIGA